MRLWLQKGHRSSLFFKRHIVIEMPHTCMHRAQSHMQLLKQMVCMRAMLVQCCSHHHREGAVHQRIQQQTQQVGGVRSISG